MTAGDNTYCAYTFRIASPIRLQGLPRTNGDADIMIEYGRLDSGAKTGSVREEIDLVYDDIGTVRIRNGRHVVIDPVEDIGDATLQQYVLGPIMGAVLYQRGYLVLHASSVLIFDTAVAFLGPSGAGKSTIAAACQERGHAVLSDDITAVDIVDGTPIVIPGVPILKLTSDTASRFDIQSGSLSAGPGSKELYRIPRGSPPPRPLKRLYVITDDGPQRRKMSPGETIQALVGSTYTQSLLDETTVEEHFRQCACVADTAEIRWLTRSRKLDSLSDTVHQIEQEIS